VPLAARSQKWSDGHENHVSGDVRGAGAGVGGGPVAGCASWRGTARWRASQGDDQDRSLSTPSSG
jgi:hypothetical protein